MILTKNIILEILNKNTDSNVIADEILNKLYGHLAPANEEPEIIGYLNRKYGSQGYKTLEIGTPVYKHAGSYFIEYEHLTNGTKKQTKYSIGTLDEHINFINK
jgi:hypothetical protein